MNLERDALAEAALRFSEAIQSERASTIDALASERQATLQVIQALRNEANRRTQRSSTRFTVGLLLGSAVGAGAIYLINQRSSEELRLGLVQKSTPQASGPSFSERMRKAIEAGKRAAAAQEQTLWDEYRRHLKERAAPPPPPPDPDW